MQSFQGALDEARGRWSVTEREDLVAICRLYLAVDPLQPVGDAERRRALAKRIVEGASCPAS